MKTTKTTPIVRISAEELTKYNPVNETLSPDFLNSKPVRRRTVFSTADLWRLRRQRRMQGLVIR
jgi:hypothetical protein